ncbi:MAG: nuclease [Kamptonema sp. SIO1D9]|nr:nuclease [Kamptonema sp. SIO1D9]
MLKKILNFSPLVLAIALIWFSLRKEPKTEVVSPQSETIQFANNLQNCQVKPGSVYDGDTMRVICNGVEEKIRFACIDAPETNQPGGIESRDTLRKIIEDGNNEVRVDFIKSDRYGRQVAEIWVNVGNGEELLQSLMAINGMVWAYEQYKSDCKNWEAVASTVAQAQAAQRGIWADGKAIAPWEWRRSSN